jgi:hypothetical protein
MHAEARELMSQADAKAPTLTSSAPVSPSAELISTDIRESGLWLWQGETPPPTPPRPKFRDQQFFRRILRAAGWVGWIAVPAGLALAFLAVSMMSHPDRGVSADNPVVALSPAPPPAITRPIVPVLPPTERTEAQSAQVQVPSASPADKITAQGPETLVTKGRAQHKSSRTARKTHASHLRKGPLFPGPGVLTPPPMTWHGGGY